MITVPSKLLQEVSFFYKKKFILKYKCFKHKVKAREAGHY